MEKKDKQRTEKVMITSLKMSIHNLECSDFMLNKTEPNEKDHSVRISLHKAINSAQRLIDRLTTDNHISVKQTLNNIEFKHLIF